MNPDTYTLKSVARWRSDEFKIRTIARITLNDLLVALAKADPKRKNVYCTYMNGENGDYKPNEACVAGWLVHTINDRVYRLLKGGSWIDQWDHVLALFTDEANQFLYALQREADATLEPWHVCAKAIGCTITTNTTITA